MDHLKSTLKKEAHIHLMGICGTAMASLAGLLKGYGYHVTGSDENVYPPMSTQLESLRIPILSGYKAANLSPTPDLVIVGNVISLKVNEEAQALLKSDIPYTSLPKALGEFVIEDRHSMVVAGTHGKTTTTSMLAQVAESCGENFGYLVGGIPLNFDKSFKAPEGNLFIIEGDEYDTAFFDKVPKFIHYRPKSVILTSIEFDHADIYNNIEEIKDSFRKLVELIPEEGLLVAHAGDSNVIEVIQEAQCPVVTYGLNQGDYRAVNRSIVGGRNQFSVEYKGRRVADIAIKSFGEHNTLNALSVYALANEVHWTPSKVLQGLANFLGVKRRQELLGETDGVRVIEDFAHHPTAVRLTVESLKERFPKGKLYCLFEPRSATSRRKIFQKDYLEALSGGDVVLVSIPYKQENIEKTDRFSSEQLVQDLNSRGTSAYCFETIDQMVEFLRENTASGDTILIMSNGSFGGIYQKLLRS